MFAGLIRPYKGVDALLDAFSQLADDHATLRFVGSAEDPSLAELLQSSADRDPRISLLLEMVPDARLVHEMTSAQVVVLPYRRLYNSGLLLAALSLARPVVVPRTATTTAISAEIGAGWVRSYEGVLTADHLREALLAPVPASPPQLTGREPLLVGLAHHDLYVEAARVGHGLARTAR
jgi:beta-1,4-mannosyltransferase